ncbi:photosystem II reaction center PSB28 protein, chloroplastic [Camellia sinensis]|uniref:photosystem II reaction center PSB28 protein, chloroplastic n=1 Tax=Camellia sinensis TaxID=4442 RepID=UPI0010357DEF|nr:photosystem II reaction center PSB28 protein, chloroplastic [Camellia sinensis]
MATLVHSLLSITTTCTNTSTITLINPSSSSSSSLITMASSLQSLAFSSPVSHCPHQTRFLSGMAAGAVHRSARSPFSGQPLRLQRSCWAASRRSSQIPTLSIMMVKPTIQFIQGTDEQTIPDVKLTKSRDGTNGMAIFRFEQPSVFDSSSELGDITGFFMIDEEGVLQSVDVSAKFINGKPAAIEAKYVMRTPREWDRFMRFMERYANKNGLQFVKK